MERKNRNYWFDIERGFFLFLALWQHYAYYINYWYVNFFKENEVLDTVYSFHQEFLGKQLPVDFLSHWAATTFTPFVSQIFLTLACFNLANRTQEEFSLVYKNKILLYLTLFLFFLCENFIVADSFGEALSLYPIMTWMILLSIISTVYHFVGIMGIVFLFIFSFLQYIAPMNLGLENILKEVIHPEFNFDASLNYFLSSSCLGFLLGYIHNYKKNIIKYQDELLLGLGIVLFLAGYNLSPEYVVDYFDVLENEHFKANYFWGIIEILGIQTAVIQLAIILKKQKLSVPHFLKSLEWVGKNSILIFAFHRIFFVHLFMPVLLWFSAKTHIPIEASIYLLWSAVLLQWGFCYMIQKTKILKLIDKD